MLLYISLDV
ncbi:hypothetical protein CFP56_011497 [Quercus suber]|uniref:Uncharacterized protein n=1 Tax=Quercus suber TaxID=58331 RepID=A0AAW0M7C2_QUESU